jgi:hypothetical protein
MWKFQLARLLPERRNERLRKSSKHKAPTFILNQDPPLATIVNYVAMRVRALKNCSVTTVLETEKGLATTSYMKEAKKNGIVADTAANNLRVLRK